MDVDDVNFHTVGGGALTLSTMVTHPRVTSLILPRRNDPLHVKELLVIGTRIAAPLACLSVILHIGAAATAVSLLLDRVRWMVLHRLPTDTNATPNASPRARLRAQGKLTLHRRRLLLAVQVAPILAVHRLALPLLVLTNGRPALAVHLLVPPRGVVDLKLVGFLSGRFPILNERLLRVRCALLYPTLKNIPVLNVLHLLSGSQGDRWMGLRINIALLADMSVIVTEVSGLVSLQAAHLEAIVLLELLELVLVLLKRLFDVLVLEDGAHMLVAGHLGEAMLPKAVTAQRRVG